MGTTRERSRAHARAVLLGALLIALSQPCEARADALADKVEALLAAGIEPSEERAAIVALGPGAETALVQVFERAQAPKYVRLRALSALPAFRTQAAARYLERLVRAAGRPDEAWLGSLHPARSALVLRRALEGLRDTTTVLHPALDPQPVSACLAHPDAHVRERAARLLETLEGGGVDQALRRRLSRERSQMVRSRLQQAITSRSARRPDPR
jgi:hypothetical protein